MQGVTIFGVTGRMGQALVRALADGAAANPGLMLCGAVAAAASSRLGAEAAAQGPASGVLVTDRPAAALSGAAVAIDFSRPHCVIAHVEACVAAGVPLVVGTTGFDASTQAALEAAAASIAVLVAPNTSVGVNVMAQLVRLATAALGADYDVEIAEMHHRLKRDAPSGTALALGRVVAATRGVALEDVAVFERHGDFAPRRSGSIGFSVSRAGDVVGEHTVTFATPGERLEITHRASDRATFAHGALRAARWLIGQPAGVYGMDDVLRRQA